VTFPDRPGRLCRSLGHRRRPRSTFPMLVMARACQGAVSRRCWCRPRLSLLTTTFTEPKEPEQGVRHIRGDRRGPAARWACLLGRRADGVPVLALGRCNVKPCSSPGWAFHRRGGCCSWGQSSPGERPGSTYRARCLSPAECSAWSNGLFQRGYAQLARRRPPTGSWPRPWCCSWRSRLWQGPGGLTRYLPPPGGARPQPGAAPTLSMLIGTAGLFGIFLFLTYYLQQTLGYSPPRHRLSRFLPMRRRPHCHGQPVHDRAHAQIRPPGRWSQRGCCFASGGTAWLAANLGPHNRLCDVACSGPLILAGMGLGMVIATAINTGNLRRGPAGPRESQPRR